MSLIFATQLTAVATVVLAVFAIITAIVAGCAFWVQSRQLEAELGERSREAEERRREQAVQVYVWQDPPAIASAVEAAVEVRVTAHVRNASQQPVYEVRFAWLLQGVPYGAGSVRAAPLMPGEEEANPAVVPLGPGADPLSPKPADIIAEVVFRDRAGLWWRSCADGWLEKAAAPENSLIPRSPRSPRDPA